jgi:D-alanyl-lipoteichoic acid acyltransferase DltB (MBOAT superfamily)
VAGPIERATHLLPQFYCKREFDYEKATDGMRQILWGLFKKVVVADNCATIANQIFDNSSSYSGSTILIGAVFFAFQIYGDFSGYSDIAIGTSRLFGFDIMQNFAYPYFSRDIAEFWRRWHISLSTWFRDYLYIPLGGSKVGLGQRVFNTFAIFIVSGFWHGANWTFIAWGALNALYFMPLLLSKKNRHHIEVVAKGKKKPALLECIKIICTFALVTLAWVFFRAENVGQAFNCIGAIMSKSLFVIPSLDYSIKRILFTAFFVISMLGVEWWGREDKYGIERIRELHWVIRKSLYYSILLVMLLFSGQDQQFIYFQF